MIIEFKDTIFVPKNSNFPSLGSHALNPVEDVSGKKDLFLKDNWECIQWKVKQISICSC